MELASRLQKKLIDSAYHALKPGGVVVYSTCTLNTLENEEVIDYAIEKYKDLKLEFIEINLPNVIRGKTKFKDKIYNEELYKTIRIIPNGYMEGFFIAKLIKL